MNYLQRTRAFDEAREALVLAIRAAVRVAPGEDPLGCTFTLVHRSSPEVHRIAVAKGGLDAGGGFVMLVAPERLPELSRLPSDHIACFISIDGHHKALGLPTDVLVDDDTGGSALH